MRQILLLLLLLSLNALGQPFSLRDPAFVAQLQGNPVATAPAIPSIDTNGLIIQWAFDAGSGSTVTNLAGNSSAVPVSNYFVGSENLFGNSAWMKGASYGTFSITDSYGEGPDGSANGATRLTCTAVAGSRASAYPLVLSNTPYTISLWTKSNADSNQFMTFGFSSNNIQWTFSTNINVTTNWERQSWTFNGSKSTNCYVAWFVIGTQSFATDILISRAQLEKGTAPSDYVRMDTNWNANLGYFRTVTNKWMPDWTSTGAYYKPGSTKLAGAFGSATTLAVSVYCVFRRYGDLVTPRYAPLIGSVYTDNKLQLMCDNNTGKAHFKYNNRTVTADNGWDDGLWHLAAGVHDGTTGNLYLDGALLGTAAASAGGIMLNELYVGYTYGYFSGDIAYTLIYTNAHDATAVSNTLLSLSNLVASRGIKLEQLPHYIIAEGDSRTANNDSYFRQALTNLVPANVHAMVSAVSGSNFGAVTNRAGTVDANLHFGVTNNILVMGPLGVNDAASMVAATYYANVKGYLVQRKAANPNIKIVLCTELPATSSGYNDKVLELNNYYRSDPSFYDRLCESTNTVVGLTNTAWNTTYYGDGIHPTAAGHAMLATNLAATLRTLIP